MGRGRGPDRAWWAWVDQRGEQRIRLYIVERGVRTTATLAREATPAQADREVRIASAGFARGDVAAPIDWEDLIEKFLESRRAGSTGGPGRKKRKPCRETTINNYRHHLGSVARILHDRDPLALTEADARTYARALLEPEDDADLRSPATVVRGLDAVAIAQRWCVEQGWTRVVTWEHVDRPEILSEPTLLQPDQVGAFMRAAARLSEHPPGEARVEDWCRWEAAAWLLLHGPRTNELQHMRVGDIGLTTGVVSIRDRVGARTKSASSSRIFPILSSQALACLQRTFRDVAPADPAFETAKRAKKHRKTGERERGPAAAEGRTKWFAHRVAATCEEAGLPRVTPHGLRHSVATAMVIAGADMHSLQALLGHSDVRVTKRIYDHAESAQRSRAAAAAVGAWLDRTVVARPNLEVVGG